MLMKMSNHRRITVNRVKGIMGFTLIELLVVTVSVPVLIGLLCRLYRNSACVTGSIERPALRAFCFCVTHQ